MTLGKSLNISGASESPPKMEMRARTSQDHREDEVHGKRQVQSGAPSCSHETDKPP